MRKTMACLLSLVLVIAMLAPMLASCKNNLPNEGTQNTTTNNTENETESKSDGTETTTTGNETQSGEKETHPGEKETQPGEKETQPGEKETQPGENETQSGEKETQIGGSDTQPEDGTTKPETGTTNSEESTTKPEETEIEYPVANVGNGEVIANANNLWAGVNGYYENGTRKDFTIENQKTSLTIHAAPDGNTMVGSITNKNGVSYIENTMDVFVKMENGRTYYSSQSINSITFDFFRFGMYYYELRAQNQMFVNKINELGSMNLDVENNAPRSYYEMSKPALNPETGAIKTVMEGKSDPRIYYSHAPFSADEYNYMAIDIKTDSVDMSYMRHLTVFAFAKNENGGSVVASEASAYVANDGEFHTYYFKLDNSSSYKGEICEFRFDFSGIIGDTLEYKNVRVVKGDTDGAPDLRLCRYLHFFSDKSQQVIQVTAKTDTQGIEEIGVITNIDASRVNAVIVKDKNGVHDTIDGVDWASAEYVAFDIADAGIFGYILLPEGDLALMGTTRANDTDSGKIKVTREGDKYVIVQSRAPKDGKLTAPTGTDNPDVDNYVENFDNCADFYMGHRIYTDDTHSFADFVQAAEVERNPLKAENIKVYADQSTGAEYLGYDALRGMYVFKVDGSNFNRPYYEEPNKHFNVKFSVVGDTYDRNMYIMTTTTHGELQSAVILDENDLMLPVPVEVGKNFSDGGQDSFDSKDEPWSEAYFPMIIKAGEEKTFNFLNIYMNWGRFPLKQISFIQLAPLYHLSTGVTETNCLLPWYSNMGGVRNIWTIPDHRPMSAPFWTTQPNHTSGGDHRFLRYTDADGNYSATEVKRNYITSYGPTYAEVVFEHLSDDGKIKAKYTHMEMPQTDENRAYYTMEYEILEDISFTNFKNDFFFYSMNAYSGVEYEKVGYLNSNNECKVMPADTRMGRTKFYTLGDYYPYFSFYKDSDCTLERGYINLSFLIKDAEFNLQAVENTPNFALKTLDKHLYLTLDLEKATLKKGDTIKINAIIMPWGSQETPYDQIINEETGEKYEDKNVRDVRENTIINELRVEAGSGAAVVENEWLPEIRLTNGKIGGFTVKGASGNSTILVSGVTELTIPMLSERVVMETGEYWVRYNLSSQYYTDKRGNGQAYDGYGVQYNADGTYTYSFVLDMSKGEDREFKITFSRNFVEEVEPEYNPDDVVYGEAGIVEGPNHMMDAEALYNAANKTSANKAMDKNKSKVMTENGVKFFRFYATDGQSEAWIMPYTIPATPLKTGKYLIMKYRLPETNTNVTRFEIWTSTYDAVPTSGGCFSYYKDFLTADNNWRILVIDLSQMSGLKYEVAPNGDYYANFLRFDFFDKGYSSGSYIDVAYIAFDDRAEDIFAYPENAGFDKVTYYDGRVLDVATTESDFPAPKVVYDDDTTVYETPFDLYLSAQKLAHLGSKTNEFGNVTLFAEDGFVRFNSHAFSNESDFAIYRGSDGKATGRYLVIKYRASATQSNYMQFYASTVEGKSMFSDDNGSTSLSNTNFVRNGEWQIAIIDLSTLTKEYTATADGKFVASLIRFDPFNGKQGTTSEYVDVAYIGTCDDLTAAITFDKSVETALVRLDKETTRKYVTATGEIYTGGSQPSTPTVGKPLVSLDPEAIAGKVNAGTNLGGAKVSSDGKYVTVSNSKGANNGFFFVVNDGTAAIGQYVLIKYRTNNADRWEWYVKTKGDSYGIFYVEPINDGQWHTIIIDLSKTPDGTYKANESDGKYYGNAIRWGIMRTARDYDVTVDVAYIAVSDNIESLVAANGNESYINYSYFDNSKVAVAQRPMLLHINSFGSNAGLKAQRFTEPLLFDENHAKYPTDQGYINTSPSKLGTIYIGGWVGTTVEATNFVFRVLDADGKVLADWADLDQEGAYPQFSAATDSGVINNVNNQVPGAPGAYNFRGYANLNAFVGQSVTVEFALVLKDVPEGDQYFTLITAKNVKVTN